ncbi:MAG: riboflavin kinase [Chitinophagaceae bacterium]
MLQVEVYAFLRGEVKFGSLDALKNQLSIDATTAKKIMASNRKK